jgi:hypothetical protein
VSEGTEGPPIWHVVATHLKSRTVVRPEANRAVKFVRAGG